MKNLNSEMENAFNKELNLIHNDMYYQQIEIDKYEKRIFVRYDISYKPLEILGGDSYSIRKTDDGKIITFMLDAMGKGISASITATTSTALLNYIFDQMKIQGDFEFNRWIKRYISFIKDNLLDNEMLSAIFTCYDRKISLFDYASFGMPSFLIVNDEGTFSKIKSNNAPISQYMGEYRIDTIVVKGIKKALFYTDGLCENSMEDGTLYKEKMYEDFLESSSILDFQKKFNARVPHKSDDVLFFYLSTVTYNDNFIYKEIAASREAVSDALLEISTYMQEQGADVKNLSELSLALSELLMNSLEHGVFNMNRGSKNSMIEKGQYDSKLIELEEKYKDRHIRVRYIVTKENEEKVFIARISDGGKGFDVKLLKNLVVNSQNFNGRGIMIVKKLLDMLYYNEKGNTITIRKFLN